MLEHHLRERLAEFNSQFNELDSMVNFLTKRASTGVDAQSMFSTLASRVGKFTSDLRDILVAYRGAVKEFAMPLTERNDADSFVASWTTVFQAQGLARSAQDARDQATAALIDTKKAAGEAGPVSLGTYFRTYANRERLFSTLLRTGAALCLLAITIYAAFILPEHLANADSLTSTIGRASLAIPMAVLAAYLGREAIRHHEAAKWARELEVQLMTFIVSPLEEEEQNNLRMEFGRRIFLNPPGPGDELVAPSLTNEATSLINTLAELLKGAFGNVDKKK